MANDNTGPDQGKSHQQPNQEPSVYNGAIFWPPVTYAFACFLTLITPINLNGIALLAFSLIAMLQLVLGIVLLLAWQRSGWLHILSFLLCVFITWCFGFIWRFEAFI